jgi:nucleoside-diphosphate-sugar epimerase
MAANVQVSTLVSGDTVAITGVSGFLASELCARLLSRGIFVHGTVRSLADPSRTEHIRALPGAAEYLTLHEADLLSNVAGYATAFAGCMVVFHTACPFHVQDKALALGEDYFVEPAVKGTLAVLDVVRKAGSVARVVLTSSTAAIFKRLVEVRPLS